MKKTIKYILGFWIAFAIHYAEVKAQYSPALWIKEAGQYNFRTDDPRIIYDGDENLYFTGYFYKSFKYDDIILEEKGRANIFVSKLDTLGNPVWIKRFWNNEGYKEKFNYNLNITGEGIDSDKNIILGGLFSDTLYTTDTAFYAIGDDHDIYLMKITPQGEIAWFLTMEAIGLTHKLFSAMSIDDNDNIILVIENDDIDILLKFDQSGELLWSKELENDNDFNISSIETDKENNIYIAGDFVRYISFGNDTLFSMAGNKRNGFYAKFDENGDYIWSRLIGSYCYISYLDPKLTIDTSMNILLSCNFATCSLYIGGDSIVRMGSNCKLLAMLNQDGNILWANQFYSNNSFGLSYFVSSNKNIYCAVINELSSYFGYSDTIFSTDQAISLMKLDYQGNIQWLKGTGGNVSNSIYMGGFCSDYSDNLYLSGSFKGLATFGDTSFYSPSDKLFLAKINDSSWIKQPQSSITENEFLPVIGPNPADNELIVNLPNTGERYRYSIYDIYGTITISGIIENGRKVIETGTLSPGIYFIVIKGNGKKSVMKFVKK